MKKIILVSGMIMLSSCASFIEAVAYGATSAVTDTANYYKQEPCSYEHYKYYYGKNQAYYWRKNSLLYSRRCSCN